VVKKQMSFTDEEIREDYMEKVRRVFTGNGGKVVTQEMCRIAAEKSLIKKNPAVSMQRRIERISIDPSGNRKPAVFINRPRIIKTFKEKEM